MNMIEKPCPLSGATGSKKPKIQIVWFKRDLRISDHAPLKRASLSLYPVVPLYIVEPSLWSLPDASRRHWRFVRQCLIELDVGLTALNVPLVVKKGEVCAVLNAILEICDIQTIHCHEETGNLWSYQRDQDVTNWCDATGTGMIEYPGFEIVRNLTNSLQRDVILKARLQGPVLPPPGKMRGQSLLKTDAIPDCEDPVFNPAFTPPDADQPSTVPGGAGVNPNAGNRPAEPRGGRAAAVAELSKLLACPQPDNPDARAHECRTRAGVAPFPEDPASRLSPHLAWGTLSAREVIHAICQRGTPPHDPGTPQNPAPFRQRKTALSWRLAWRRRFGQNLEDHPELETQCGHPKFEGMREQHPARPTGKNPTGKNPTESAHRLQAWANGQTGFPLIDAAMRNLITEGWIPFRLRALVISFAAYQLWLDWRVFGPYLARLSIDYEPAIHLGQLQLYSGISGRHAVRIYDPLTAARKLDPDGAYIRRWVSELSGLDKDLIHTPGAGAQTGYPAPVIDAHRAGSRAGRKFQQVREQAGSDGFLIPPPHIPARLISAQPVPAAPIPGTQRANNRKRLEIRRMRLEQQTRRRVYQVHPQYLREPSP